MRKHRCNPTETTATDAQLVAASIGAPAQAKLAGKGCYCDASIIR